MDQYQTPLAMDRQLDVLHCHTDGGLLLGASCLTGRFWLGSLWYYQSPEAAPDVDRCTAGVQLEAGIGDAKWVDTTHVLVGLDTGGIALWNLEDDYHTFVLSHAAIGHDDVVTSVSVVCDKAKAASSSLDRSIKLWDLSNMSLVYSSLAHSDLVSCIDCHPSQPDLLLSCAQDDKLLFWDRRKPKPASILNKSPLQHIPTCVRWMPNSEHRFAIGSESGQIAMLDTRMAVHSYLETSPHSRAVYSLQFCPNQPSLLASISEDCKAAVLSISQDSLIETYKDSTHQDFVHGLTWSSESQLFTCGWDARVLSHNIKTGTATILGQEQTAPVQVNGDVEGHGTSLSGINGTGETSDCTDKSKPDVCKPSYSQAVKVKPEISAEG